MEKIMKTCVILMLLILITVSGCSAIGSKSGDILDKDNISMNPTAKMYEVVSKSNWAVSLCLIGFVISVFAFLNGSKVGLAGMGASAAGMFMGLALARFAMWMAVFGLIGSLVAGLASILAKKKALTEIIVSVQKVREGFQVGGTVTANSVDDVLEISQSKTTRKLVAAEKHKLKLKSIKKGE